MRSIALALLAASLCSCAAPLAAPVLYPATMEVSFIDPADVAPLKPEVRTEIARGILRLEKRVAELEIDLGAARAAHQIDIDDRNAKMAEIEGLRVWAGLAKGALGFGAAAVVTAAILAVVSALK